VTNKGYLLTYLLTYLCCNVALLMFIAGYDFYQSCYQSSLLGDLDYVCGYDETKQVDCR